MRAQFLAVLATLLSAGSASAQSGRDEGQGDGWSRCGGRSCFSLSGGDFTLTPRMRIDADAGSFLGQDEPGGFRSGVNLRRGRLTAEGTLPRDLGYTLTWEFGGNPNDHSAPYEAQLNWSGLGWATLRAGGFNTAHLPEFAGSSFDLLFLERTAMSNIAGRVASGDSRLGIGLEGFGERWVATATVTAGTLPGPADDRERGLAGRGAVLVLDGTTQLQLGLNLSWQFSPSSGKRGERLALSDFPELRVDSRQFLDTGSFAADDAYAWGPEVLGRLGPVYLEGVYQAIGTRGGGEGDRRFHGWYVQGAVPLFGMARQRDEETGTWTAPSSREGFDPARGEFGALEIAARRSVMDLRDQDTRGNRQSIWAVGVNWYPVRSLRLAAQYQNGRIEQDSRDRPFQSIGLRASLNL